MGMSSDKIYGDFDPTETEMFFSHCLFQLTQLRYS